MVVVVEFIVVVVVAIFVIVLVAVDNPRNLPLKFGQSQASII